MATIELTKENFNDVVCGAELAFIDFWHRLLGVVVRTVAQQALEELVGRARVLDMDEVRRKRAARGKTG